MEEAQQYTCPQCGYDCRIGESDDDDDYNPRMATHACLPCREVVEVVTATFKVESELDPRVLTGAPVRILSAGYVAQPPLCMRCGTEVHTPWDRIRRPCPRCATPMNLTELKVFFRSPDPPVVTNLGDLPEQL